MIRISNAAAMVAVMALQGVCGSAHAGRPEYLFRDLGGGVFASGATSISNSGVVAGYLGFGGPGISAISDGGILRILVDTDGNNGSTANVSAGGALVSTSYNFDGTPTAIRSWSGTGYKNSAVIETEIRAAGVNDAGMVVGNFAGRGPRADPLQSAVVVSDGTTVKLPGLGGWTHASGINNSGTIVGSSSTPHDPGRVGDVSLEAVTWNYLAPTSAPTILGRLPLAQGLNHAQALAASDTGIVVGSSLNAFGVSQATLWSGTAALGLGDMSNVLDSEADAINANGSVIVGYKAFSWSGGNPRPWLWLKNEDGTFSEFDINSFVDPRLGITLDSVTGVNDAGQIVGQGHLTVSGPQTGADFAYELSPVPEPASALLSLMGLGFVASRLRPRKQQGPKGSQRP